MTRLFLSIVIGAVMGVIVPWYCSSRPGLVLGGVLDGRALYFTAGGTSHTLTWSWPVFVGAVVLAYIALAAAEQRY